MRTVFLANGIKVVLIPHSGNVCGIQFVGEAGSLYTSPGLSHFLEHTVLCASEKYPDFNLLAGSIDPLGIFRNAFTSHTHIHFVFKCLSEHIPAVFNFLAEVTIHPLLKQSDVEKQKKIIIQEIDRQQSDLPTVARLLSLEQMYGKNGPGIPVLGDRDAVTEVTVDNLRSFFQNTFVAERFFLVIVGTFDETNLIKTLETTIGAMPKKDSFIKQNRDWSILAPSYKVFERPGIAQASIQVLWKSCSANNPSFYSVLLFKYLMTEGRLSRLWNVLRQESGLAYSTGSALVAKFDYGNFSISTGVAKENVDLALEKIHQEINTIAEKGISLDELARLKNLAKTKLLFAADSAFTLSDYYAGKISSNPRFEGIAIEVGHIESVTVDQLQAVARGFSKENAYVTVVKPADTPLLKKF